MGIYFPKVICPIPDNYAVIDKYVSRSAQPVKKELAWLKQQGVTDIFNFRTSGKSKLYDEREEIKKLGLVYHSIPSVVEKPSEENVNRFLKEIDEVKEKGGKAHIHCMAGADRTGMYAFIYKMANKIGSLAENKAEWIAHGFHADNYPYLMQWAENFIKNKFGL